MKRLRSNVAVFCAAVVYATAVCGQPANNKLSLVIRNEDGRNFYLSVYSEIGQRWYDPDQFLRRNGGETSLLIAYRGLHFLGLIDDASRWRRLGSYDLYKLATDADGEAVTISWVLEERQGTRTVTKTVYEDKPQTYTVTVPHQKTRQGTRTVYDPATRQYVQQEYTYEVTVYHQEQRTRTIKVARQVPEQVPYTYTVETPSVRLSRSGVPVQLGEADPKRPRLGVRLRDCGNGVGVHVDSVIPDSPATNLYDDKGNKMALEAGDHILSVNGATAGNAKELDELISSASPRVKLEVLNVRTGRRLRLSGRLAP